MPTLADVWTPARLAVLIARAEGDDETAAEAADLDAHPEHAAALLEQVERGDGGEEEPATPPPTDTAPTS